MLVRVFTCQNATLLEILCPGSYSSVVSWGGRGGPDPLFHPLDPRIRKAAIKAHAASETVFATLNCQDVALVFLRTLHLTVCLYQPGKRRKHSLLYRSARSLSLEGCHV